MAKSPQIPCKPTMAKLTRQQIAEGLKAVPMDTLLLGAVGAKQTKLTAKQRKFAEQIALGNTKAGAYRAAYDTQSTPATQSRRGQELTHNGAIAAQITAIQLAHEAQKYATPAALRSLVVSQLTAHAINDDLPPSQRLRALELLGKVTEVAAFTERREIIKVSEPGAARAALLASIRLALRAASGDVVDVPGNSVTEYPTKLVGANGNSVTVSSHSHNDATGADTGAAGKFAGENPGAVKAGQSLPADPGGASGAGEPSGPGARAEPATGDPTPPPPPRLAEATAPHLLSNPHVRSDSFSDSSFSDVTPSSLATDEAVVVTGVTAKLVVTDGNSVTVSDRSHIEGGWGIKSGDDMRFGDIGNPPGGNWVEKGVGG